MDPGHRARKNPSDNADLGFQAVDPALRIFRIREDRRLCKFWIPISPKLIEVGIEIWYAGGTASKTMVVTADQLTIANC